MDEALEVRRAPRELEQPARAVDVDRARLLERAVEATIDAAQCTIASIDAPPAGVGRRRRAEPANRDVAGDAGARRAASSSAEARGRGGVAVRRGRGRRPRSSVRSSSRARTQPPRNPVAPVSEDVFMPSPPSRRSAETGRAHRAEAAVDLEDLRR